LNVKGEILRRTAKILLSLVLASGGLIATPAPAQAGCSGDICLSEACAAVDYTLEEYEIASLNFLNCTY
jgi:hypothetical protein